MDNKDRPAFPVDLSEVPDRYTGLTKREYFAGLAMQGLLSCNATYKGKEDPDALCRDAIKHADILLKQLETKDL